MVDEHWTSADLLARYRGGDQRAAEELFERYVSRLTLLARARLSPRLASRTDPEDVVLSAWRSFFIGARSGRFTLRRSGDLWRLLVSITMHKLYHQVRRQSAEMRSVDMEQQLESNPDEWRNFVDREPAPEEGVALADELQAIMVHLDDFGRRVLELRLQDYKLAEIAAETDSSERTVRRCLARIRELLTVRLEQDDDG